MPEQIKSAYDELAEVINTQHVTDVLNNIEGLVGDITVSQQIDMAIKNKADKDHVHNYVNINDFNALKKEVERLIELVGDATVSEQISAAIQNISK